MQRIEVTIPDRLFKKLERHSDDPSSIDTFIRRALEQYVARLDKIDADAEYAKAHGHYPERERMDVPPHFLPPY